MGIRFLCESCGKRLNVKAHQAGKNGRCPHCGELLTIPMESTLANKPPQKKAHETDDELDEQKTTQFTQTQTFAAEDLGVAATQTVPSPSALDSFTVSEKTREGDSDDSITLASNDIQESSDDSFMLGKPTNPAVQPGGPDPIAEAPNKVWYIRHAKDGETGPVRGTQLREMLDEGQVKPGSVVWREDWQDWEKVGAVFSELAPADSSIADRVFSDPNCPLPKSGVQLRESGRRIRKRLMLTVAIVLGVATIGALIYLLVSVLNP